MFVTYIVCKLLNLFKSRSYFKYRLYIGLAKNIAAKPNIHQGFCLLSQFMNIGIANKKKNIKNIAPNLIKIRSK